MANIVAMARPDAQSEEYRFFVNNDTGNKFKAKQIITTNESGEPLVSITVSQIDVDGKAILDETGKALIVSTTHILTQYERTKADFNADALVLNIVEKTVEAKELDTKARKSIADLAKTWIK